MKILHFLWGFGNGGAENLVVDLANEQASRHEVLILVANRGINLAVKERVSPSVQILGLDRPEGSKNPSFLMRLVQAIVRFSPDVIHAHAHNAAILRFLVRCPLVLTVHDVNISMKRSVKFFDAVCCISKSVYDDVSARYPSVVSKIIDNGIVTRDVLVRRGGVATECFRGVQVSRLVHEKKGQDVLLRALRIANDRLAPKRINVDLIGDGPSLAFLRSLALDLGVESDCRFLGAMGRTDIYSRLCNYDLLVQPSRYEGFGLTVAEAMAAEIPVVVSDIEGPMEIIDRGRYGYTFKTGDEESLARTLEIVVDEISTPSAVARLKAAKCRVIERYDIAAMVEKYSRVYEEVCNEH